MLAPERRQIGAHYTSERDILKQARSLFLDDLHAEFETAKRDKKRLSEFHRKIAKLTFLDPACGCGNFLVVTYRELRLLEIEILRILHGGQQVLDIHNFSLVDVDAMYGIEIKEFPVRVAEVAMWLMDHQMNQRLSEAFGQYFVRLPLTKSATIKNANALRIDWREVLPAEKCSYVMGNPPFVGKHLMSPEQGEDMELVWGDVKGIGVLDYVTAWYRTAAEYIQGTTIRVAFVSTNSISQGEQVAVLWKKLFAYGLTIDFAHTTFTWESEARGKAHVHVVIIGFSQVGKTPKTISDYSSSRNAEGILEIVQSKHAATNISPYLTEGPSVLIESRSKPLCDVPASSYGSKPADGGFLIVEEEDRATFLESSSTGSKFLRPLLCADEFLHNTPRWCIWLADGSPNEWRTDKTIMGRVQLVKEFRLASKKRPTREAANSPSIFAEIRQPKARFIVVPQHTSERRRYIPLGFFLPDHIVHNSCTAIPNATDFHFGILSSVMHMAWVRQICGRIKSDYRYSTSLVYNNFPWPESPTAKQNADVEAKGAVGFGRTGSPFDFMPSRPLRHADDACEFDEGSCEPGPGC